MPDQPLVKCLVWDLDNTLWQGTLLEYDDVCLTDGVRDVLAVLDSRGILQSVASKNDHDLAWARLEQLGVAEYFVVPQIGWGRKSDSVRAIAQQLRFAPDTVALIDDQLAEHAEVTHYLPQVRTYAAEEALSLPALPEFSPATVTSDARRRRRMYQAGFLRDAARADFPGPDDDFLRTLDLVMHIARAGDAELARVEELTLRTSQMNATGVHYPLEALRGLAADPEHEVLVATLTDRFGQHGAIGVMLLRTGAHAWHLKLLATSCRVMSFGAGAAMLNWLVDQAALAGVHIVADFLRTDRNRIMEVTYRFAGFTDDRCECAAGVEPGRAPGGVARLHLVADRRSPPGGIRLVAPDLAAVRAPSR